MNASTAYSTETIVAPARAERLGRTLLLVNGGVLVLVSAFAGLSDLAGHYFGLGPFAMFEGNYDSIAFVEAHGLAFIMALLFLTHRAWPTARWNWIAAATHLLLGGSNLMFWPLFIETGTVPMGVVMTAMHLLFVGLHVVAALARTPALVSGPGATFRIASAITLATGVALHIWSLPLGREVFHRSVLTPLVDTVFAIPMTIAGVAGLLLWRRAILPTWWEKIAYGFVVLFLLGSVALHLRTLFTWDTSYVLAFPDWYPLPAFVYLSLIGLFTVTRRFAPAPGRAA
jgi:hypothetical protein